MFGIPSLNILVPEKKYTIYWMSWHYLIIAIQLCIAQKFEYFYLKFKTLGKHY